MPRGAESHRTVHGAASWRFASDCVEGFLTRQGGHLGPVHRVHFKGDRAIFTACSGRQVSQQLDRSFLSAP